jgi:hypothetical protein
MGIDLVAGSHTEGFTFLGQVEEGEGQSRTCVFK